MSKIISLNDILILDDRSVQICLREFTENDLALAMLNLEDNVREKFYKNMSERAIIQIKEIMDTQISIPEKDKQEAQNKILHIIQNLSDDGKLNSLNT